jgi:hypothetical protein
MKHYTVTGTYGKATPIKVSVNESDLESMKNSPLYTIVSITEHVPHIRYATVAGCERCTYDEYVPHFNCMYKGNAMGHSASHCTADACY